jgi:probable HAF family extracellular repeat protein
MQPLPDLPSGVGSGARDADVGGVAGVSSTTTVGLRAVRWTGSGVIEDMGTLPGGNYSYGHGINAAGWVAGVSSTSSLDLHAVLWTAPNQPVDLGVLPGATMSEAEGVNDAGWVAGYSAGPSVYSGFVWTDADGMLPLAPIGPGTYSVANDINGGVIVGVSQTGTLEHATMWIVTSTIVGT